MSRRDLPLLGIHGTSCLGSHLIPRSAKEHRQHGCFQSRIYFHLHVSQHLVTNSCASVVVFTKEGLSSCILKET